MVVARVRNHKCQHAFAVAFVLPVKLQRKRHSKQSAAKSKSLRLHLHLHLLLLLQLPLPLLFFLSFPQGICCFDLGAVDSIQRQKCLLADNTKRSQLSLTRLSLVD